MEALEYNFPDGTYKFITMSRSVYTIIIKNSQVFLNRKRDELRGKELRMDSENIEVLNPFRIEVGQPAILALQTLDPKAAFTTRITSPVVKISQEN